MLAGLIDYSNPQSLGSRLRKKRFRHIEDLVKQVLAEKDMCSILDVGGTAIYWGLMSESLLSRCRITICNLQEFQGANPADKIPKVGIFELHTGDGCDLSEFDMNSFDIVHSNSVIEHVGKFSDMSRFACEMRRVGRRFYLQTPNFWFPIETHYGFPFVHWLPKPLRARLLVTFNVGFLSKFDSLAAAFEFVEIIELLNISMLRDLFPDGYFIKERFFLLPKSLITIGPSSKFESEY